MIKLTTISSLLMLSAFTWAQDYNPLNSPSKFVETGGTEEVYFFAESTMLNGGLIEMKQYQVMYDSLITPSNPNACPSYGQPTAATDNWLGRDLVYNQILHSLSTDGGLTFDFGIPLGDSALIGSVNNVDYYMIYTSKSEEIILNYTDSVKTFSISAYDAQGTSVNTGYSSSPIRLAKQLGLVNFINLQDISNNVKEYEIIGQVNNGMGHLGNYAPTYDEVYPWDYGDTLQYFGYSSIQSTQSSYAAYNTVTVQLRTETTDSVYIHLNQNLQTVNSGGIVYNITYDPVIKFKKGEAITTYPANYFEYAKHYEVGEQEFESFTGAGMRMTDFVYDDYCDSCHCFPAFELQGVVFENYTTMAPYGSVHKEKTNYDSQIGITAEAKLVFANVDGNIYGNFVAVSVDELEEIAINIAPNPTTNHIQLSTSERMIGVEVYTLTGELCRSESLVGQTGKLNLSSLQTGVYLLHVRFENGQVSTQRIVKM